MTLIHCWYFIFAASFASGSFTIQSYHDLAAEYEERLSDFNAQHRADPFSDCTIEELEKICQKVETSKIFLMADKGAVPAPSVIYSKAKTADETEAQVLNDFDSRTYQPMPVVLEPHIVYPSDGSIAFPAPEIEFLGLAEPRPSLSASLMVDSREIERYFINAMAYRGQPQTPPTPEGEPLCWLNVNQQFRLCCQAASALRDDEARMEINHETFHTHNCGKRHLFLREIHENGRAYLGGDLFANAVVCGHQSTPNFLLVSDPRTENSVFVIRNSAESVKMKRSGEEVPFMEVVAHIKNISALRHARHFY